MRPLTRVLAEDEAVRILSLELQLSHIDDPSDAIDPRFPTLHFVGISEGGSPHESKVRGKVEMMSCKNCKWSLVSNYDGEDRWSSIGVQVGRQRGGVVYGNWSVLLLFVDDPR